jgi:hypothetical protein
VQQFTPDALHNISAQLQEGLLSLILHFANSGLTSSLKRQLVAKQHWRMCLCCHLWLSLGVHCKCAINYSVNTTDMLLSGLLLGTYMEGDEDIKKSIIMFVGEKLLCKVFSTTENFICN